MAGEDGVHVALNTALDTELLREGRVLDLIHQLNRMRKEQGLALTDRVIVTLPATYAELLPYADWIQREALAVKVETTGHTETGSFECESSLPSGPASVRRLSRSAFQHSGAS